MTSPSDVVVRHPLYKSVMCRAVKNGRECPYFDRCQFAHTPEEMGSGLITVQPAPSYTENRWFQYDPYHTWTDAGFFYGGPPTS